MKKILLLLNLVVSVAIYSQVLETENFDLLTVGNVANNITGTSAGQGGYYLYASGGAVTDAQIVNEGGTQGKVLQVTASAGTASKFVYKGGLAALWASRTSGNNVVDVEYDFFTGPTTTSKNTYQLRIYDATGKTLVGLTFAADTKIISGLAYYINGTTSGTYIFPLGPSTTDPDITLPANTWVRVGCSFNKTTGEVDWKGPGFNSYVIGASIAVDIDEVDFLVGGGTGNTISTTAKYDNYSAVAKSATALLSTATAAVVSNNFTIYPNPATDIVNISKNSAIEITAINISDINGRIVKQVATNVEAISVSDLSPGVYFVKINTASDTATTKLVKN